VVEGQTVANKELGALLATTVEQEYFNCDTTEYRPIDSFRSPFPSANKGKDFAISHCSAYGTEYPT
jgi:hypothetical protein